jgi:hypothetical protein
MARITHRNDRMHRGLVPTAQLGSGSATSSTVLLGDQTWGAAPASGVTVQDEGSGLATAGTTLNFVGAGVTASGTGATKTITVPGSTVSALDDLSDVTITSPAAADRLRYNGSAWVNSALVWRPAMVLDPTSGNYLPIVTGDGDAVMTEA